MIENFDDSVKVHKIVSNKMGKTFSVATAEEKNDKAQGQYAETANLAELNNSSRCVENLKTVTKEDDGKNVVAYDEDLKGPNISKKMLTSSIVVSFSELADSRSIADACKPPQTSYPKPQKGNIGKETSLAEHSFTDTMKQADKQPIDFTIIGKQEPTKANLIFKQREISIAAGSYETTSSCVQKWKRKSSYNNSGKKFNSNSNSIPRAKESKIVKTCQERCNFLNTLTPEIAADLREFGKHEMKKFNINSLFAKFELTLAAGLAATLPRSNKTRGRTDSYNDSVQNSSSDNKQESSGLEATKTQTVKICEQNCDFLNSLTSAIIADLQLFGKHEMEKWTINSLFTKLDLPLATVLATTELFKLSPTCFIQETENNSSNNDTVLTFYPNTEQEYSVFETDTLNPVKTYEEKYRFLNNFTPEIINDIIEFGKHEMKKFTINSLLTESELSLATGLTLRVSSDNSTPLSSIQKLEISDKKLNSNDKQRSLLFEDKPKPEETCENKDDFLNTLTPAIMTDLKQFGKREIEKFTIYSLLKKFELPLVTGLAEKASCGSLTSSNSIKKLEKKLLYKNSDKKLNSNDKQRNLLFEDKPKPEYTCEDKDFFLNTWTPAIISDLKHIGKREMEKLTINSLLAKVELPVLAERIPSMNSNRLSSIRKLEKKPTYNNFDKNNEQINSSFENEKSKPKNTCEDKDDFLYTLIPAIIADLKQFGKRETEKLTNNSELIKHELPIATRLQASSSDFALPSNKKTEKKTFCNNYAKNLNSTKELKIAKTCNENYNFLNSLTTEIIDGLKQMGKREVDKLAINSLLAKFQLPSGTVLVTRASFSNSTSLTCYQKSGQKLPFNNSKKNFNWNDKQKNSGFETKKPKPKRTCEDTDDFLNTLTPAIIADLKKFGKREMEKCTINSLLIKHGLSLGARLATSGSYCDSESSSSIKKINRKISLPVPELKSLTLTDPVNTFPTQSLSDFSKINEDIPSFVVYSVISKGFQGGSLSNDCNVSQDVTRCTDTGTKKKETNIVKNGEELEKKVSSVRKQMSKIRFKLNDTKKTINTRANTAAKSQQVCIENDQLAVWAMSMGTVRKPSLVSVFPPVLDCQKSVSTDHNCPNKSVKIPSMEFFQSSNSNKQKTREQLETEVAALQNLVYQLALNNQINNIPQALLPTPHSIASFPTHSIFSQNAEPFLSANALRQPSTRGNFAGNENSEVHRKRRNRGKKKKTKNNTDKEVSMNSRKLCKYINAIMKDYFKGQENLNTIEYEYGESEDLEEYAQRCVRGDLGRIVEAEIRINRRNNFQSFVTVSKLDTSLRDGAILKPIARNFAFDGDIVRAFVLNESHVSLHEAHNKDENRDSAPERKGDNIESIEAIIVDKEDDESLVLDDLEMKTEVATLSECPKAFVIRIVEKIHNRQVVGTIKFESSKVIDNEEYFIFKPHDMRIQLIYIPARKCQFTDTEMANKKDISGFLYVAQVIKIQNGRYIGDLIHSLGECGDIKAEINAILIQNKINNVNPYGEKYDDLFSKHGITTNDLNYREDLRKMCIFTIDPLTAKDLDDAVSCEKLPNGNYEVGVHISDVSHYLTENSELDNLVKHRATSIYLVNDVIHMLPRTLCLKCSLLPGEDKLAFSTFWIMNAEGEIQSQKPRFTRSVINSCAQFAYEHVQKIIEYPNEKFCNDDFPLIHNGFTIAHVIKRVHILNEMAKKMRSRRYENGALSINNIKLWFTLDPLGEPCAYNPEDRLEANFLIEEFMLLANQSTARLIYDKFPNISLLRNHAPPLPNGSRSLKEKLSKLGIEIDMTTSKGIYKSLQKNISESDDPEAMEICLSQMLTKPMARAKYFCSGTVNNSKDLWHYALSIPIYTHFTSPIRRYADILVHRLLSAALGYTTIPQRTTEEVQEIAKNCNEKKMCAKNIGDETALLFFKRYIKMKKSVILRAVITEIFRNSMQAITIETGHSVIISYRKQNVFVESSTAPAFVLVSEKGSIKPPTRLQVFSTINVELSIIHDDIQALYLSPSKTKMKAAKICN